MLENNIVKELSFIVWIGINWLRKETSGRFL
jgi:hypothetical protein